jgi:hypothetical protein
VTAQDPPRRLGDLARRITDVFAEWWLDYGQDMGVVEFSDDDPDGDSEPGPPIRPIASRRRPTGNTPA